jgi:hypothetical protein
MDDVGKMGEASEEAGCEAQYAATHVCGVEADTVPLVQIPEVVSSIYTVQPASSIRIEMVIRREERVQSTLAKRNR